MLTKEEIISKNGVYFTDLISSSTMDAIKAAMDEYANQDKWISVKDELPKKDQTILTFGDDGYVVCDYTTSFFNVLHTLVFKNIEAEQPNFLEPTHWQLLPNPPKQ